MRASVSRCVSARPPGTGKGRDFGTRRSAPRTRRPSATNEHIRAAERELEPPLEHVPYLCECDDVSCRETIRLAAPEYERVREDGATFAIAPGHPSEGDVLERHDGYLVVRKRDGGGEVARALDPRGEDA